MERLQGWFGVRRELRTLMLLFLVLCVAYLGGWGVMFVSTTFRWTFITWSFFSMIATTSVILTVTCLILGLLCRMNFGKGLLRYRELTNNHLALKMYSDISIAQFMHRKLFPVVISAL
jgi:hypothetical protein